MVYIDSMDKLAMNLVYHYVMEHIDKTNIKTIVDEPCVYIVWKCRTLQNWKWLISTDSPDGMYYEVTYNGNTHQFYLDAYKKFENRAYTREFAEYILMED